MASLTTGSHLLAKAHRMATPQYYPCRVRLDGEDRFVAWYTAETDGFARYPNGRLMVADAQDGLDVALMDDHPTEYDFDRIQAWCDAPDATVVDCAEFLNAWNFFDDLARLHTGTNPSDSRIRQASECYNRLFWGNNLPAVTPPEERFKPSWSATDLAVIREVFEAGLRLLRSELAGLA